MPSGTAATALVRGGGAFRKESGAPVIDDLGRRVDRGVLD
jgi:hypothetical protein